jgi:two-component system, NarL family, sensor histidine kinase DevS
MSAQGRSGEQSREVLMGRLLDVAGKLASEADLAGLLEDVLAGARELTGARYAAMGVLDESRTELAHFLTAGIDPADRAAIGDPPHGLGVLGKLIVEPAPLRLRDVGAHPESFGFPPGHPVMRSFLGVPIPIGARAWGNLYLTEKAGGEFTQLDQDVAVILAGWAGIAIENARLRATSEHRRRHLERVARRLAAAQDIAVALGAEIELDRTLELIARRGRALVGARALVIMLRDDEQLIVRAAAGEVGAAAGGSLPIEGSRAGNVLQSGRSERIDDVGTDVRSAAEAFGVERAKTGLLAPMLHRGGALGVLAAFDRGEEAAPFSAEDEQMLRAFAASAATAVALGQSVEEDRLRRSIAASDAERRRWARELHDQTLQGLGALRVLLRGALRGNEPVRWGETMREAIGQIEQEIASLRAIIFELRPAVLEEVGLAAALGALLERHVERAGLEVECDVALPDGGRHLSEELEMTAYRIVQEALTNVVKHAAARRVRVELSIAADRDLVIAVRDDGRGFDPLAPSAGHGLPGMRERAQLAAGTIEIASGSGGTVLRAVLPLSPQRGRRGHIAA